MIPPGGEGNVTLEVKTDNLKGKTTKSMVVISNDPDWPELKFQLTAIIKPLFQISPQEQVRIQIQKGESWSDEFTIKSIDGLPFKITDVKTSNEQFEVNYSSIDPVKKNRYLLKFSASSDIAIGHVNTRIEIYTDISDSIPEKIRIYGSVEGSISYYPKRITFYPDHQDANRDISRNIHIIKKDGKELKFEGINIPHQKIKYGMIEIEKGRNYVLALIWTGKDLITQVNGNAILTTNDKDMPRIIIPYTIFPGDVGR